MKTIKNNQQDKPIGDYLTEMHDQFVIARDAAQAGMALIRDLRMQLTQVEIKRLQAAADATQQ